MVTVTEQTTRADLAASADRTAAPSIRLSSTSGTTVRLADFARKPVVLNFWATACGGCKAELPIFVSLDHRYRKEGLSVVGISMDIRYSDLKTAAEGWSQVKPFLQPHHIDYTIMLDDGSAEKAFNVTALPATYLIDRTGRVAATYLGVVDQADIERNVRSLLAEH
jgi:peroxiredoxin